MATILVVEDKKEHRRFICDALRSGGHEPLEAENGEDALEILRENGDVDLVTLDYAMPRMNGAQFINKVQNDDDISKVRERSGKTCKIPTVVITVFETEEAVKAMRALADAFLSKPLEHNDILETVESVLKKLGA